MKYVLYIIRRVKIEKRMFPRYKRKEKYYIIQKRNFN